MKPDKKSANLSDMASNYSPSNYPIYKLEEHNRRIRRLLLFTAVGLTLLAVLFVIYLQNICQTDTWYNKVFGDVLGLRRICTNIGKKLSTQQSLEYQDGKLTLVNDLGTSTVAIIPQLVPGGVQSLIGANGLPGAAGATGVTSGAAGTQGPAGATGPAGPAGPSSVDTVVNDVNVTGSIAANVLTLGWTGQLAPVRGGTGIDASAAPAGGLLIGNGTGYTLANILGTANQVTVTNGAGSIGLSLPQDIAPTSNVTFADLTTDGTLSANGSATFGDSSADRVTFNSEITGGTPLAFQGSVDDANTTTLAVTNPTGVNVITLPDATGTFAVSATGPISLNSAGDIGCTTCVTTAGNGDILSGTGIALTGTTSGRLIGAGNVTFALNTTAVTAGSYGSATAIPTFTVDANGRLTAAADVAVAIDASQIASGVLPIIRGGTNSSTLGAAGTVGFSDGASYSFTAAGTSGQVLTSAGAGTPTWTSLSGVAVTSATGTANQVLVNATTGIAQSGAITLTTPQDIGTGSNVTFNNITADGSTILGDVSADRLTVNAQILGATPLVFQGATDNAFTTTFAITDPTVSSKTITFPNASGTVAVSATGPITLSALGDIGCATCVVSGGSLFTAAATSGASSAIAQGGTLTIAAGNGVTTTGNGTGTVTVARTSGTATGDVEYWDGSSWVDLPIGTAGEVLSVTAGLPSWEATGVAGDPIVGNEVLDATIAGGLVRAGAGTVPSPYTLGVDVTTAGTTVTTSSNSGLEVAADGLSLLRGCGDQEVLVWTSGSVDWSCAPYVTGGGGTITSINSQSGPAVTINNASGAGNAITIDDATTVAKGIASFSSSNFTVTAGAVNLSDTTVIPASYAGSDNADGSLDIPNFTVDAKGRLTAAGTSIVTLTGIPNSSLASSSITVSTGTTGTDFNVSGSPVSLGGVVTLNIPDASTANRGLVTIGSQTFGGDKTFNDTLTVTGTTSLNGNTTIGNATTDRLTINSQILNFSGGNALAFQGATDNAFTTTIAITDPSVSSKTIILPDANGTFAVSASSPITLSAAGNIACATCLTSVGNGDIVNGTGMASTGTLASRLIGAGNVTFNLSNTGVTAASYGSTSSVATFTVDAQGRLTTAANAAIAISAAQITSGTLPIVRGGTNQTTIGSAGSIAYSDGASYQFNSAGTSGQVLTSGGAGSPTWTTLSGITVSSAAGTANQVLVNGTSGVATTGAITLTTPQDIATTSSPSFSSLTLGGDLAVNGGDITSSALTFNLLNTTVTTLNIGGAATTANYGPAGATATTLNFAGGSGATGCTIAGATGNLTCSGAIATTATTGTQGWWSRAGTTLSPATAGDSVTTTGSISTTGTGTITSAGLLTSTGGVTTSGGAFSLTGSAASTLTTTAGNTITIVSGTTGAVSFDSGTTGAVNLGTGASAKTVTLGNNTGATTVNINSGTGNINLQPGGTGTTANVQIGAGGAGSATPDLLVLDRKSTAGDPTGTNGAMYYNESTDKFRCFENSVWRNCIKAPSVEQAVDTTDNAYGAANICTATFPTTCVDTELDVFDGTNPSITPTSTTERVQITGQVSVLGQDDTSNYFLFRLRRGSAGCAGTQVGADFYGVTSDPQQSPTIAFDVIDSPASVAAQTYTLCSYANESAGGSTNPSVTNITISTMLISAVGADLAETFYTYDNAESGDVVSLDGSMKAGVRKTSQAYDSSVLGIISTKPGYILSDPEGIDPTAKPVQLALSGRVPVKISDENGLVKAGDPLTASSKPGQAMKATGPGWVIGMAMEDQKPGQDKVLTFVNRAWYPGDGNTKAPSLTGVTLTDGRLAGVETAQTTGVQQGLESNDPQLVSQALDILHGIQTTVVGQQTQLNDLASRVAKLESGGGTSVDVLKTLTESKAVELGGDLTVNGDVVIAGKLSVGKDTAGEKTIPAGATKIDVTFSSPYAKKPVVNATAQDFVSGEYRVTNITASGFNIELSKAQAGAIKFSWNALAQ